MSHTSSGALWRLSVKDAQSARLNTLIVIETGGLRILHWGDNRHNAPDEVWDMLGRIAILLAPGDGSQHVMGHRMVNSIVHRLQPSLVLPHPYFIVDVHQGQHSLLPPNA